MKVFRIMICLIIVCIMIGNACASSSIPCFREDWSELYGKAQYIANAVDRWNESNVPKRISDLPLVPDFDSLIYTGIDMLLINNELTISCFGDIPLLSYRAFSEENGQVDETNGYATQNQDGYSILTIPNCRTMPYSIIISSTYYPESMTFGSGMTVNSRIDQYIRYSVYIDNGKEYSQEVLLSFRMPDNSTLLLTFFRKIRENNSTLCVDVCKIKPEGFYSSNLEYRLASEELISFKPVEYDKGD